jgi:hypothetical protein
MGGSPFSDSLRAHNRSEALSQVGQRRARQSDRAPGPGWDALDVATADPTTGFLGVGTFYGKSVAGTAVVCPTGTTAAGATSGSTGTWGSTPAAAAW